MGALLFLVGAPRYAAAQPALADSLLRRIGAEKNDSRKIDLSYDLYFATLETDPEQGLRNATRLLTQARHHPDPVTEAMALFMKGANLRQLGQPVEGLKNNFAALTLAQELGNDKLIAAVENSIGNTYKDQGQYEVAISHYAISEKKAALSGESSRIRSFALMNLGEMHFEMNRLDSALFYLREAEGLCNRINYRYFISSIHVDLAEVCTKRAEEYDKQPATPITADLQRDLEDESLEYLRRGLREAKATRRTRHLNWAYTALAGYYKNKKTNNKDSAAVYLKKTRAFAKAAVRVVRNTKYLNMALKSARLLAEGYEAENGDSSLKYSKIYRAASDSLLSLNSIKQIQMLGFHAEERSEELQRERAEKLQYTRIALVVMTLFSLFLVYSPFVVNKERIKPLGRVAFLMAFEFFNVYTHPYLEKATEQPSLRPFQPLLLSAALILMAAVLLPMHHAIEEWAIKKLLEKNRKVQLAINQKQFARSQERLKQLGEQSEQDELKPDSAVG